MSTRTFAVDGFDFAEKMPTEHGGQLQLHWNEGHLQGFELCGGGRP